MGSMSGSNLPPGVSIGDLPGNRPEDAWYDAFLEALEVPPWAVEEWKPEDFAGLIGQVITVLGKVGSKSFGLGRQEGRMDAADDYTSIEEGDIKDFQDAEEEARKEIGR